MKVGVLGTGNISHEFLGAARVHEVEVVAVYNRSLEKANTFAQVYEIPSTYDNYDEFLLNNGFDTVYVGLPNGLHYEYGKKALQAGKNVLIEKPFASNMKQFDELVSLANERGLYLIEMDRVTAQPNFQILKERLPEIGDVKCVTMDFCQYSRKWDSYKEGNFINVFSTEFSGGALLDLGVYCVNLAVSLFGKPESLVYVVDKLETGVDITGNLVMKYPGRIVSIVCAKNSIGDKVQNIQGEKGSLRINGVPGAMDSIYLVTSKDSTCVSVEQEYNGTTYTLGEMKRIIDNKDWEACALRLMQSRKVMQVLDAARKSADIVFPVD